MSIIILAASFAGYLLIYSLFMIFKPKTESIEDKINRLSAAKEGKIIPPKKLTWKDYLTKFSHFAPSRWAKKLDLELHNSGINLKGGEFIVLLAFLFLFSLLLVPLLSPLSGIVFVLPVLSLILPRFYLIRCRNKRIASFNHQLSNIMLTLANSLKAGFSLLQSLEMAAQEMPDPISSEIKITLREMTYGESTENALTNFAARVKSKDLDLMVTAILIQRQIGGNLAEVLTNIHSTIQERLRIRGEVKGLTAQGRLSGYIVGAIPIFIAVIISFLSPDYIGVLFTTSIGRLLIITGVVLQVIGFIAINKIVDIQY